MIIHGYGLLLSSLWTIQILRISMFGGFPNPPTTSVPTADQLKCGTSGPDRTGPAMFYGPVLTDQDLTSDKKIISIPEKINLIVTGIWDIFCVSISLVRSRSKGIGRKSKSEKANLKLSNHL